MSRARAMKKEGEQGQKELVIKILGDLVVLAHRDALKRLEEKKGHRGAC